MKATRRCFLSSALGGWVTLQGDWVALSQAQAASGRVYVFAIANMRPHVQQRMLESAMPGIAVSVFGRVGDFSRALDESPPDAAVAMTAVLEALGLEAEVQGTRAGSAYEEYLVISETEAGPEDLKRFKVGCIDFVGRKKLPQFVASVLGLDRIQEVQRVARPEDLLQLLQIKRADAVLLPERFLADLREASKMDFKIVRLPSAKVLRTAVAFPGNRKSVEPAIRSLPLPVIASLGVDAWS